MTTAHERLRGKTERSILALAQTSTSVRDDARDLDPALARACRVAAADGIVVLKNDHHVLPFDASTQIAVFGRVQNDYFTVGYGSGGDVNAPYSSGLMDAVRHSDRLTVDAPLGALYAQWCADNRPDEGCWGHWPWSYDEMPLAESTVREAAERSDVALVVIGRAAGEARENALRKGSYYLTDAETAMLTSVTRAFERTVVVLDAGNLMDLSWAEGLGDRLSGLVLAWQGGMESGNALVDVLSGAVEPSGRLTDTIARHYSDYPSAGSFGGKKANAYVEDIFVGYRYFETFAQESVLFPFGYGLGYTTFEISTTDVHVDATTCRIEVRVTNRGTGRAGREVVQVYGRAPDGYLGKAARELLAFRKTDSLAPGEHQDLRFSISVDDFASYDDGGVTGHRSAWVLEPGRYEVYVGPDARDAVLAASFDRSTLDVVRQCVEAAAPDPRAPFERLTAVRDGSGTVRQGSEPVPTATADLAARITRQLPAPLVARSGGRVGAQDVVQGTATLEELVADLSVDELVDLCRGAFVMNSPLGVSGNAGVFGGVTEDLRARGIPPVTTADGPSGIRVNAYASQLPCGTALASTWDPGLVESVGALLGEEMRRKKVQVLLSPGLNIHRDPLCGRAFEYYSEDPLVTGLVGAAMVRGIQSAGVAACPKHFACNNQEVNRGRHDSRVSERALREIYLRGFEIVVRDAWPKTIMTSYNKVNGVHSYYSYDLCTTILRDEWGFQGMVMTDWWTRPVRDPNFPAVSTNAYRVRAGVDVLMPGGASSSREAGDSTLRRAFGRPGGITLAELQRSAVAVVRAALDLGVCAH